MKVILLREVDRLGKPHDIVDVKSGYARNYLIPKHLAIPATEANVRGLQKSQSRFSRQREKMKTMGMDLVERFKDLSIKTTIKTGIEGNSFGSITSHDVALLLKDNDIEIDKKHIVLEEPIKHPGVYDIKVHLAEGVNVVLKLVVIEEGA
jgi:large subunit ribosomal protein L9